MARLSCPMHADEDVEGTWVSDEVGWSFTCDRTGHVDPGPFTWISAPPPPPGPELTGLASELGLDTELPAAMAEYAGRWVEFGVVERAYALANPRDWEALIRRFGHTAILAKRYTVSAFLARTLGDLVGHTSVRFHSGPATGRWSYNSTISWWALAPEPSWDDRLSWADSGFDVSYVPGQTEVLRTRSDAE